MKFRFQSLLPIDGYTHFDIVYNFIHVFLLWCFWWRILSLFFRRRFSISLIDCSNNLIFLSETYTTNTRDVSLLKLYRVKKEPLKGGGGQRRYIAN